MNIEIICRDVLDCADRVHTALGGGFNETVHQNALAIEFREIGFPYLKEVNIEIFYKDHSIGADRPDFILLPAKKKRWDLDRPIVLEIKVAPKTINDHRQQLKTYLKSIPQNRNSDIRRATHGILLRFSKSDSYVEDQGERPSFPIELERCGGVRKETNCVDEY